MQTKQKKKNHHDFEVTSPTPSREGLPTLDCGGWGYYRLFVCRGKCYIAGVNLSSINGAKHYILLTVMMKEKQVI